mmetsp:Transcript_45807/g.82617  ORF Transcript_45807/g.82617 Transcript_45807/m.82617 type:complete len:81 (-) Transcript_45807:2-244(-)
MCNFGVCVSVCCCCSFVCLGIVVIVCLYSRVGALVAVVCLFVCLRACLLVVRRVVLCLLVGWFLGSFMLLSLWLRLLLLL